MASVEYPSVSKALLEFGRVDDGYHGRFVITDLKGEILVQVSDTNQGLTTFGTYLTKQEAYQFASRLLRIASKLP